jgi:hypothetical protein
MGNFDITGAEPSGFSCQRGGCVVTLYVAKEHLHGYLKHAFLSVSVNIVRMQ